MTDYHTILAHFGIRNQEDKLIDECAELVHEVYKNRASRNLDGLASEIADVENMLEQVKIYYKLHEQVKLIKFSKIERTLNLIQNGRDNK